jgi:hypothetical protein
VTPRLFIVVDRDRWGHSTNLVRAESKEAAAEFVCPARLKGKRAPDVEEIDPEKLGILWCEDESPDTPYDGD